MTITVTMRAATNKIKPNQNKKKQKIKNFSELGYTVLVSLIIKKEWKFIIKSYIVY